MTSSIEVVVYSARGLPKVKETSPDTFCMVQIANEKYCTDKVKRSCCPVWSSITYFKDVAKYAKKKKDIKITCFATKKAFLGKVRVSLEKLKENPYFDDWIPLKDRKDHLCPQIVGELHVKVTYLIPGQPTPRPSLKCKEIKKTTEDILAERSELIGGCERIKKPIEEVPEKDILPAASLSLEDADISAIETETERIREASLQCTRRCLKSLSESENTGADTLVKMESQGSNIILSN